MAARVAKTARSWALVLSFGVVFCGSTATLTQKAMAEDCGMSIEAGWLGNLVASAHVSGECGLASIELVVRNGVDEVVWSASYASGDLFGFDDIAEADAMRGAVSDWLVSYAQASTSGALPAWPQGADMPDAGEFPFYVEDGLTRQDYEDLRAANFPMVCYIQGRESTLCLVEVPDGGALVPVGAQSFPG